MEGISIIHDQTNNKKYVQIDMERYGGEYLDDLLEGLVANSRRNDEAIPLDEALEELRAEGKLDEAV